MRTLINLIAVFATISLMHAQDLHIEDEQAHIRLTTTVASNGSVLNLDNMNDFGPTPSAHVIGAINFANPSGTVGQIGYRHGGFLAPHTVNFRISNTDVMTLTQTTSLAANSLEMSNGAVCTQGGVWTDNCSAKLKNLNKKIQNINILDQVAKLPIYAWTYKSNPSESHIGPTAEDFNDIFNLTAHPDKLAAIDLGGVSLAAIQQLHLQINQQAKSIEVLQSKIHHLQKVNEAVKLKSLN